MKIIKIEWLDSMHENGWKWLSNIDFVDKERQVVHTSVGFLVKETKEFIYLVQSIREEGDDASIDAMLAIPKVSIKSRTFCRGAYKGN